MSNIVFIKGNLFASKHQTLVNTINCVGIMGAGVALEFKYRFPLMFSEYVKHCEEKRINIGKLWVYSVPNSNRKILNFPTKYHWKYPSKIEYLEAGLTKFIETYQEKGITSIAFPLLGAQNGGLDPEQVKNIMFKFLSECPIPIEIYQYDPSSPDDYIFQFKRFISSTSLKDIEKQLGLKKNIIIKIKNALDSNRVYSLIQISNIKGVGEESVQACFNFMSTYIPQPSLSDMFNETAKIENIPNTISIDNKVVTKSNISNLSVWDKAKISDLPMETVSKIEKGSESITIEDLRKYCTSLGLDLNNYFRTHYGQKKQ